MHCSAHSAEWKRRGVRAGVAFDQPVSSIAAARSSTGALIVLGYVAMVSLNFKISGTLCLFTASNFFPPSRAF